MIVVGRVNHFKEGFPNPKSTDSLGFPCFSHGCWSEDAAAACGGSIYEAILNRRRQGCPSLWQLTIPDDGNFLTDVSMHHHEQSCYQVGEEKNKKTMFVTPWNTWFFLTWVPISWRKVRGQRWLNEINDISLKSSLSTGEWPKLDLRVTQLLVLTMDLLRKHATSVDSDAIFLVINIMPTPKVWNSWWW